MDDKVVDRLNQLLNNLEHKHQQVNVLIDIMENYTEQIEILRIEFDTLIGKQKPKKKKRKPKSNDI